MHVSYLFHFFYFYKKTTGGRPKNFLHVRFPHSFPTTLQTAKKKEKNTARRLHLTAKNNYASMWSPDLKRYALSSCSDGLSLSSSGL